MRLSSPLYFLYERKLEREVAEGAMPEHLAIIMDGNRRYARDVLGSGYVEGHRKGKDKLREVVGWCHDLGIRNLTAYTFSTENFNRPQEEVDAIMGMLAESILQAADEEEVETHRVRINYIGDLDMLPQSVRDAIRYSDSKTHGHSDCILNIAVAYGGRQDIVIAARSIARDVKEGRLDVDGIDESVISSRISTYGTPDPDLMLRTSGELRLSNFLLWQLAYSELYFTDVYWPGFRRIDLLRAIREFQKRKRRYGA